MTDSGQQAIEWRDALDRFLAEPSALRQAFMRRWTENGITLAPAGLPASSDIARDHGWSVALELYLLSLEVADARSDLLRDTILEAASTVEPLRRGEAWLEDVLALRRLPPVVRDAGKWAGARVDWRALEGILALAKSIARDVPEADLDAYLFMARLYHSLTNALVSEIVETAPTGRIALEYDIGRRIIVPNARSMFRSIIDEPNMDIGWGDYEDRFASVHQDWRDLIAMLVDTLALLNRDLANLPDQFNLAMRPEYVAEILQRRLFVRQLDQSFYRLLKADNPNRFTSSGQVDDFVRGLETLSRITRRGKAPYGFYSTANDVTDRLWERVDAYPPLCEFGDQGLYCLAGADVDG